MKWYSTENTAQTNATCVIQCTRLHLNFLIETVYYTSKNLATSCVSKNSLQLLLQQYTHTRLTALRLGLHWWAGTRKVKTNLYFYWSKRHWVAVASAGQVCISLQTDNHAPAPHHSVFTRSAPIMLWPIIGWPFTDCLFQDSSSFNESHVVTIVKSQWYDSIFVTLLL